MSDVTSCLTWKERRVWVRGARERASRRTGDLVYVGLAFMVAGDVDLGVQLDNGEVKMVWASQQGRSWISRAEHARQRDGQACSLSPEGSLAAKV